MTVTGSSVQYRSTRSTGSEPSSWSSSSAAISSVRVRNFSTARTLNTRVTSLR